MTNGNAETIFDIQLNICDFTEEERTNGKEFTIVTFLFNNQKVSASISVKPKAVLICRLDSVTPSTTNNPFNIDGIEIQLNVPVSTQTHPVSEFTFPDFQYTYSEGLSSDCES